VWGARTLAGNDNEWRYVSVRRFFNMVEESCKQEHLPSPSFEAQRRRHLGQGEARMIENYLDAAMALRRAGRRQAIEDAFYRPRADSAPR
jgi:hypothetical protein